MNRNRKEKGVTLIALVITIIVLLVLAGVTIAMLTGDNGILRKTNEAEEENNKQTAAEKINLKITTAQMNTYAIEQRMPTLKELSLSLKEDGEIQYVTDASKVADVEYDVKSDDPSFIYTKLNDYPYEFGINNLLRLESIDGVKIADNNNDGTVTLTQDQYNSILSRLDALENNPNTTTNGNYSTEEQVVGTWLDGKPIYQKTIETSWDSMNTDAAHQHSLSVSSLNIDTPISIVGIAYLNNNPCVINGPTISDNTLNYATGVSLKRTIIIWTVGKEITKRPGILKVTIQYTKTTDQATTN